MTLIATLNHLLNFVAPALALAVLLVVAGHVFMRKAAVAHGWIAPIAISYLRANDYQLAFLSGGDRLKVIAHDSECGATHGLADRHDTLMTVALQL